MKQAGHREFITAFTLAAVWVIVSSFGLPFSILAAFVFLCVAFNQRIICNNCLALDPFVFRYYWIVSCLWAFYFVFEVLTVPLGTLQWMENAVFSVPFFFVCLATERIEGEELKRGRGLMNDRKHCHRQAVWKIIRVIFGFVALLVGVDLGLTSACYTAPLFKECLVILVPVNCVNSYADFRSSMTTAACFTAAVSWAILTVGDVLSVLALRHL